LFAHNVLASAWSSSGGKRIVYTNKYLQLVAWLLNGFFVYTITHATCGMPTNAHTIYNRYQGSFINLPGAAANECAALTLLPVPPSIFSCSINKSVWSITIQMCLWMQT